MIGAHSFAGGSRRELRAINSGQEFPGDPDAVVYVVAEPDPLRAVQILKTAGLASFADIEDLGRVSDALLKALALEPGQFRRT